MGQQKSRRPGLLVSVRSAAEAELAVRGGAALIDVKEPQHGSLGRAEDATIAAVLDCVAGRLPVSVALGELAETLRGAVASGVAFVKWGLADAIGLGDWQSRHRQRIEVVGAATPAVAVVTVAYADWRLAGAPAIAEVVAVAQERPGSVLLLDTWQKAPGRTLLDWLSLDEIGQLRHTCRETGLRLALAGSLGPAELRALLPVCPDWFAVRGAACVGGRTGTVSEERVRGLVELLAGSVAQNIEHRGCASATSALKK